MASSVSNCEYSRSYEQANNTCLFNPSGIAVDSTGNVYYAEYDLRIINKINYESQNNAYTSVSTIAGRYESSENATDIYLAALVAFAVDNSSNIYIGQYSTTISIQ